MTHAFRPKVKGSRWFPLILGSLVVLPHVVAAEAVPGDFVYLDRTNWNGSVHHAPNTPGKIGGWARDLTIPYSFETIAKFDLSGVSGTPQSAKLRFRVTGGVTGVYTTVTAFEANKGSWSASTVKFDTFCASGSPPSCSPWNSPLGSVNVSAQAGWHEIQGSALLAKVQQWKSTPSSNNGLVLSGNFYTHEHYVNVDAVELIVGSTVVPEPSYAAWAYSSPVILNTSSSGANVTGAVQGFPLLIRLNASNFNFSQAKSNGSDLRFSRNKPDGSVIKLPLQIERWDTGVQKAEIWVKVDEIKGSNATQAITMHWGHADPPMDSFDPVFGSANQFRAVYHIAEFSGGAAGGYKEATPNGYHATGIGGMPAGASSDGQIAKAQWFDGIADYLDLPDLPNSSHATVSAWYLLTSLKSNAGILSNKNWSTGVVHFKNNNGTLVADSHSGTLISTSAPAQTIETWYHVAYTYTKNGAVKIYVNGAPIATSGQAPNTDWVGTGLEIGHESNSYSSGARFFHGVIDEARVETVARPDAWIKLCYENQKTGSTLVSIQQANGFLPLLGGTMYGEINLSAWKLDNVGAVSTRKWRITPPDYVFEPTYQLPSLASVEAYTKTHRHLPDIPSAPTIEQEGLDLSTMNLRLLKQVEHLHLYLFDQDERMKALEKKREKANGAKESNSRGQKP